MLLYLTNNLDEGYLVPHPSTGDMIDTSRINVLSNLFINNYVALTQLFIQGAFNVNVQLNRLQNNSFPFLPFYPKSLTSIPIFTKILVNKDVGYSVSSAV